MWITTLSSNMYSAPSEDLTRMLSTYNLDEIEVNTTNQLYTIFMVTKYAKNHDLNALSYLVT